MMCSVLTLSIGNNQRMVAPSLARSSSRSRVCSQSLFGKVCEALWQAGDFIKDDEPQDNRVICQMNDSIPEVIEAMRACVKEDRCIQAFLC
jgi:ribulose 1,5-bisphosphate carboxylase large subunit-like protein